MGYVTKKTLETHLKRRLIACSKQERSVHAFHEESWTTKKESLNSSITILPKITPTQEDSIQLQERNICSRNVKFLPLTCNRINNDTDNSKGASSTLPTAYLRFWQLLSIDRLISQRQKDMRKLYDCEHGNQSVSTEMQMISAAYNVTSSCYDDFLQRRTYPSAQKHHHSSLLRVAGEILINASSPLASQLSLRLSAWVCSFDCAVHRSLNISSDK